ncbi:hypothetical protein FRB99_006141 [Tulasnella sp. 403]|nr:hypothetical protein FRB99_006141 [Tulasnella sp. 403]
MKESNVDVLIIGAGPAGLMCAQGLAAAGVDVRIIDKRPKAVPAGQADGIQPRTLEVLQSYGLAERLFREGNQMHMTAFYNPSPSGGIERTGRAADVTAPTARYPFEVTLHQGAIERIFLDRLAEHGIEVDRPMQPTSLELSQDEAELNDPQAYPVKVVLKHLNEAHAISLTKQENQTPNGTPTDGVEDTEVVRAKYVLGADGAHSWVRKTLGFTMDGEQTDYIWGVVDSVPETDFPDIRNRTAIHSKNGSCMVIPREGDTVRLYVQLSEVEVGQSGRLDKAKMGPEQVMETARKSFAPYKITFPKELEWWTIYIIGQRVASSFSARERVFIAGDACHTHSPKAGQGMNASMNDTHNLVWKLTHVLRGWAQPSLLKTYEAERRKYAQDLIDFDKKFSALFSGKPRSEDNEDGVTHEEFLKVFQTFGQFTSGIGIHYQDSTIVDSSNQAYAKNLVIGQRCIPQTVLRAADCRPYNIHDLMPSDTRFKVLLFVGDLTDANQLAKIQAFATELDTPSSFIKKFTPAGAKFDTVFDIITVTTTKKEVCEYTLVPAILRSHWSKVFVDDIALYGNIGGITYESYGISSEGAVVIVRPDGYVGMVAPFDGSTTHFDGYFSQFLKSTN